MTPTEQQTMNAAVAYLERQCGNLAREGAKAAMLAEALAIENKALKERNAELEKAQAKDNVVPLKEPA